ncbi:MAG: OB-fold nucleic acid binding domain-containing protein, partial [Actinomycetota bacterium]
TSLNAVGIEHVLDLVTTYPRRWVDRSNEARIADLVPGEEALVLVTVRSVRKRQTRNRRSMVNVNVGDGSGRMDVVFFNQPWRERQLREGLNVALFGKVDTYRGGLQMSNPVVDLIGDRTGRIVPIYPQSEKAQINTWEMAGWVEESLRRCAERGIADPVPADVTGRLGMLDRASALHKIHLPDEIGEMQSARRRLAFDELLRVQLLLVLRKRRMEREQRGIEHVVDGELVERFRAALPYPLTGAQERAIAEIGADLAASNPMHRLLQGDVGAGKTVVAVATMLAAVDGGHQAALMAPTEVLAEQHAASVRALLDGITVPDPGNLFGDRPLRVELLTNRITGSAHVYRSRCRRRRRRAPRARPCADPGGGRLRIAGSGRRRRATPVRRGATGGAARQSGRRAYPGHARDDRHTDPADRGDDRVRRSRRVGARRAAAGPHADRHPPRRRPADGDGCVGRRSDTGRRRPAGLCRDALDRREREARGRIGAGDVRSSRKR